MHDSINKQVNIGAGLRYVSDYMKRMQAASPSFFHAFQGDSGNVFWTDAAFQANYINFGDTVRIDTSYRANRLKLPFVTFTGINHHAQPVLFGCGLLLNESENTFIWLLQTWLQAMSGRSSPVSVTTDPDRLVQMAVAQVLPDTHHRFCRWSLLSQTQEKLAHVCQTNPTFDIEFKNCINEAGTVGEFESCWAALLDRSFLMDNEWLQSVYRIRDQWIPVYMRGVFFGELSPGENNGGTSLFFDGFASNTTSTVQLLMKQYEKAISSWQEKELKEEFDTSNAAPVLKTPSPMEKRAANLYTRRIFIKFQEELVETLANPATMIDGSTIETSYRVAKFGEEHKAHTVRFNLFKTKATCTCRTFEFSGIICRHVLSVFRAKKFLTLPSDYVLKRWTKNAKTDGGLSTSDNAAILPNNHLESITTRRDNLRQEAMKYVEEGAKSIQSYNMAMGALREASKRVAAFKSKNSRAMQGTDAADKGNLETHASYKRRADQARARMTSMASTICPNATAPRRRGWSNRLSRDLGHTKVEWEARKNVVELLRTDLISTQRKIVKLEYMTLEDRMSYVEDQVRLLVAALAQGVPVQPRQTQSSACSSYHRNSSQVYGNSQQHVGLSQDFGHDDE